MNEESKIKRILFVQATSEIGGSDISLLRMIEVLDKTKFCPVVLVPGSGPIVEKLKQQKIQVIFFPAMLKATTRKGLGYFFKFFLNYPGAIFKMVQLIQREKIDLVHTNVLHNFYGFLAAKLAGRPHVIHVREIVMHAGWFRAFELFLARTFSDRIIVTSDAVASMFGPEPFEACKKLIKISNSIDTELYCPENSGDEIYADLNLDTKTPLVGLVCRLDHWKGVDDFLKAAKICSEAFPKARYLIVGGAIEGREDYADQMDKLSDKLGLKEKVYFTNWKYGPDQMPKVQAALDCLVLASSWPEPFGLVLLEAMASGNPIVATNHGGPTEICVQERTAYLVEPKNPKAMAEGILKILQNPEKAKQMGEEGRKRVCELYDRRVCIKKLEELYSMLLS